VCVTEWLHGFLGKLARSSDEGMGRRESKRGRAAIQVQLNPMIFIKPSLHIYISLCQCLLAKE
jgi:hypothetical protein